MNITRENYESIFTDYLDGHLTSVQINQLRAFLLLNDDLAEILEDLDNIKLSAPKVKYHQKSSLKKDTIHGCPDYYAIATAEDALTDIDIHFLKQHPHYNDLTSDYLKLKFKPDLNIHYDKKNSLYHPNRLKISALRFSTAAILLLLIGIGYLFHIQTTHSDMVQITNAMIIPISDLNIDSQPNLIQGQEIKKTNQAQKLSEKSDHISQAKPEALSLMQIITQPMAGISSSNRINDFTLITKQEITRSISPSEIYLAEAASYWKSSERNILSDNIFTSMINTGKMIAEKIRNKEYEE